MTTPPHYYKQSSLQAQDMGWFSVLLSSLTCCHVFSCSSDRLEGSLHHLGWSILFFYQWITAIFLLHPLQALPFLSSSAPLFCVFSVPSWVNSWTPWVTTHCLE